MLTSWTAALVGISLLSPQTQLPLLVKLDAEAVCSYGRAKLTVDQYPPLDKRERTVALTYNGKPVARSAVEQVRQRISKRTVDQISVLDCGKEGARAVRFLISLPAHLGTEGQRPILFSVSENSVSFN